MATPAFHQNSFPPSLENDDFTMNRMSTHTCIASQPYVSKLDHIFPLASALSVLIFPQGQFEQLQARWHQEHWHLK